MRKIKLTKVSPAGKNGLCEMFFCLFQWLKDARFLSPIVGIDLLQNSATEC
jgi:hypothetical protein